MTTPLFEMTRGDDFAFKIAIVDSLNVPVDITGWEFMATMKLDFMDPDDKATVAVNIGPVSGADAVLGVTHLVLPNAQTRNLLPALYFFDLQKVLDGSVVTIINGRVKVKADVTQRITP
ncbi:hypothetical protein [Marinobacter shengliensis]|uniref:hypothetical protein n=1 Tax=Marinobacter shengliensis TaxID=1389223 RepID=UPI001E46A0D3|nr:hypothetical protein [Marinobacter shengliensis]MCD1628447.1 hypothetical protein [Marinobacter shengliensis]